MNDTASSTGTGPGQAVLEGLVVDPKATQAWGEDLLARLAGQEIDEIFIWDEPESAVLAHVLGLVLDVRVKRALEVEGLAEAIDAQTPGAHVLVLSPMFVKEGSWRALTTLTERSQGTVSVVAAVRSSEPLDVAHAAGYEVIALQPRDYADAAPGGLSGTSV